MSKKDSDDESQFPPITTDLEFTINNPDSINNMTHKQCYDFIYQCASVKDKGSAISTCPKLPAVFIGVVTPQKILRTSKYVSSVRRYIFFSFPSRPHDSARKEKWVRFCRRLNKFGLAWSHQNIQKFAVAISSAINITIIHCIHCMNQLFLIVVLT